MENSILKNKIIEKLNKQPEVLTKIDCGRINILLMSNNTFMYQLDGNNINWAGSQVRLDDGRVFDTANAKLLRYDLTSIDGDYHLDVVFKKGSLTLTQHFQINPENPYFTIYCQIEDKKEIRSNYLVPLNFPYPSNSGNPLFLSLEERMLLVPFDNDMWVHYQIAPLKAGQTSYDVTAIFDENNNNGLVIGAIEFEFWKNGIVCATGDARSFKAVSGISDAGTHDCLEHGYKKGKVIRSARFVCGYYNDIKEGLQQYSSLVKNPNGIFPWNHGVPFGWNSYSALTLQTNLAHYNKAADFLYDHLPEFKGEDGTTFINLDAVIGINKKQLKDTIRKLHDRGQKAGTYLAPLAHLPYTDLVPLKGFNLKCRKDIVLKKPDGSQYDPIDGKYPIDITIPEAEKDLRLVLRDIVDMGFDYLKIDFLTHGCLEGVRYNKEIVTGRQALEYFYNILLEELDPAKIGKEIFISSSISPVFPCGYTHARRSSCDAFGHHEDVRYILNALTYGYWMQPNIYQFLDPDHTVLYQSLVDGRDVTNKQEANSRYNASIISGTVMLLSDNYGPDENDEYIGECCQRTGMLTNNKALNDLARLNKPFIPVNFKTTSEIYYLVNDGHYYLAFFNFDSKAKVFSFNPESIGAASSGKLEGISEYLISEYKGNFKIKIAGYDSIILELKEA